MTDIKLQLTVAAGVTLVAGFFHAVLSLFLEAATVLLCTVPLYFGAMFLYVEIARRRGTHHRDHLFHRPNAPIDPLIETIITVSLEEGRKELRVDTIRGEAQIYIQLRHLVDDLPRNATLKALCYRKNWDSVPLEKYFRSNVDAVCKRNVSIKRIFVNCQDEARRECEAQRAMGIDAKLISESLMLQVTRELLGHGRATGFAIADGRVFFHLGLGEAAEGYLVHSTLVAKRMERLFDVLEVNLSDRSDETGVPGAAQRPA